jgi:hypothetical protein
MVLEHFLNVLIQEPPTTRFLEEVVLGGFLKQSLPVQKSPLSRFEVGVLGSLARIVRSLFRGFCAPTSWTATPLRDSLGRETVCFYRLSVPPRNGPFRGSLGYVYSAVIGDDGFPCPLYALLLSRNAGRGRDLVRDQALARRLRLRGLALRSRLLRVRRLLRVGLRGFFLKFPGFGFSANLCDVVPKLPLLVGNFDRFLQLLLETIPIVNEGLDMVKGCPRVPLRPLLALREKSFKALFGTLDLSIDLGQG